MRIRVLSKLLACILTVIFTLCIYRVDMHPDNTPYNPIQNSATYSTPLQTTPFALNRSEWLNLGTVKHSLPLVQFTEEAEAKEESEPPEEEQDIAKEPKRLYLGKVKLTGYDACVKCCGKTDGITASGRKAEVGVTVAASSDIPFGTLLEIEGLGIRRVDDRGGAIKGNRIDVFCATYQDCYRPEYNGYVDVWRIIE